jgi:ADP-ribose pyrophosphatase YjhB (NUDIX family)
MKDKKYAGVLVKTNNKVLLCKRNNIGERPGEWSIPCGKVNEGETPIDGVYREFHEETNLKLKSPLNLSGILKRYSRDGQNLKGNMYVFTTETNKEMIPDLKNASDGEEHTECGYFGTQNLPKPIGNELAELIKKILS